MTPLHPNTWKKGETSGKVCKDCHNGKETYYEVVIKDVPLKGDKVTITATVTLAEIKNLEKEGYSTKDKVTIKREFTLPSAKDTFHKDCKGCHEEQKKANRPAGPIGCTQCHVKAK